MELSKAEIFIFITLLEKEESAEGLYPNEKELLTKLQSRYDELERES